MRLYGLVMNGVVPWTTLEEAIDVLKNRRDLSARQIEALSTPSTDRQVLLLLQYVAQASMLRVANWANDKGWRMPSARGNTRPFVQDDIRALILDPPPAADPALHELAKEIFGLNSKAVKKRFW